MGCFLSCRHAYHSVSTPPVCPQKNIADVKLQTGSTSIQSSDAVIIHPGAMLAMLDLLASVGSATHPEVREKNVWSEALGGAGEKDGYGK